MSEIRDGLETAEQAIYESLGLVLPGAVALSGAACVLQPDGLSAAVVFAGAHPWLALGLCYLIGYPLQSLSRPIVNLTLAPAHLVGWLVGKFSPDTVNRVRAWQKSGTKWLQRGHKPKEDDAIADGMVTVALSDLQHESWRLRLQLATNQRLRERDVTDLSFSTLGTEQRRLHRFRAITSLNRAMAAIVAVAMWTCVVLSAWSAHVTLAGIVIFLACLVLFLAFRERADMYDRLWNGIVGPQYLANRAGAQASDAQPVSATTPATLNLKPNDTPSGLSVSRDAAPSTPTNLSDAQGTAPGLEHGDISA